MPLTAAPLACWAEMAALASQGLLAAHALDCQETLQDDAKPGIGDCQQVVAAALALAFGDSRRVEWRTGPSSWREQLRTSVIAGKAPNTPHQRGRAEH